jgi:Ca-activated chloride channel homolog
LWYVHPKTILAEFQFTHLFQKKTHNQRLVRAYRSLIISAILLAFLILSGPKQQFSEQQITKKGIDIVLVIDVSYSMEADDLSPNRMTAAKAALKQFIATRESDAVGLVIFA